MRVPVGSSAARQSLVDQYRQFGSIPAGNWPQKVQCPCMTASALSTLFFNRISGKERKESL
jgi:hypothetical protein